LTEETKTDFGFETSLIHMVSESILVLGFGIDWIRL
jgi:hypothetical protein